MGQNQKITEAIPEILEIGNEELRRKVIEAWTLAYHNGSWKCPIEEIPFNDKIAWVPLIKHTRSVTQEAAAMAKHLKEKYNAEIDMDKVLAIAILHDCCKAAETEPDRDGKSVVSAIGKLYPHGTLSFQYAKSVGLPDDVCHAVLTHTGQCRIVPSTLEGLVVRYIDSMDADVLYFMTKLPTLMERHNK